MGERSPVRYRARVRSLSAAGPLTLLWRPRRRRRTGAAAAWLAFAANLTLVVLLALAITQLVALFA